MSAGTYVWFYMSSYGYMHMLMYIAYMYEAISMIFFGFLPPEGAVWAVHFPGQETYEIDTAETMDKMDINTRGAPQVGGKR